MSVTTRRVTLEDSPEAFWERFSSYAQTWPISPEPLGSPLLEVLTPWGPLFVFDRTLAPCSGEAALMIFHGQVERWEVVSEGTAIEHLGGGRYRVKGQVGDVLDAHFFVLKLESVSSEKNLLMVLAAPNPPNAGAVVRVDLAPPLMVFRADANSR